MNLLNNKDLLRGLLKQSDLINTINGGVSETAVEITNSDDALTILVSAPSVPSEAFRVILNFDRLTIFSELSSAHSEPLAPDDNSNLKMPMFVRTFEVPQVVDTDKMEAYHESGLLRVVLPYKNHDSLQRLVTIKKS